MAKESKHHMLREKNNMLQKNANNDVLKVWIDKKKVQDDISQTVRTPWVMGFGGDFYFPIWSFLHFLQ